VLAFEPVGVGTGLFVGVYDVPERVVTGRGPGLGAGLVGGNDVITVQVGVGPSAHTACRGELGPAGELVKQGGGAGDGVVGLAGGGGRIGVPVGHVGGGCPVDGGGPVDDPAGGVSGVSGLGGEGVPAGLLGADDVGPWGDRGGGNIVVGVGVVVDEVTGGGGGERSCGGGDPSLSGSLCKRRSLVLGCVK
jgi:hypothetical protein